MMPSIPDFSKDGLRWGYTTGSCAAAAAKAAAIFLLDGRPPQAVSLQTPKGICLRLCVEDPSRCDGWAQCAVRKDSGDDPDVTNGVLVYARVWRIPEEEIRIDGGIGVGRVTKPGLDQPVGAAAINRSPREMITRELRRLVSSRGLAGGFQVEISIPEGAALAAQTFNPRMGIVGGISVLGTTGMVEPMSQQALIDTIRVELDLQAAAKEPYVLLTPGNLGETFLQEQLGRTVQAVQCGNFIGEALDLAVSKGFQGALVVGHIGKLVKLAGNMFQTHSRYGDCRMDILIACAAVAGGISSTLAAEVAQSATTDHAMEILSRAGLWEKTLSVLLARIQENLVHRTAKQAADFLTGAVLFSRQGYIGQTPSSLPLWEYWKEKSV